MIKERIMIIISMLLFGSLGLFITNTSLLSSEITLFRGLIGGFFVLIYSRLFSKHKSITTNKEKLISVLVGVLIGINWVLLFEGYKLLNVSTATILYYMAPIVLIFYGVFLFKEKISFFQVFAVFLAFFGLVLVVDNISLSDQKTLGILMALSAAIIYASVMSINKHLKKIDVFERVWIQLLSAGISIIPYVLLQNNGNFDYRLNDWIIAVVLGVFHTGVAYSLFYTALNKLSHSSVAILSYIDPVSALFFATVFLQEQLNALQWGGALLILIAIFLSENKKIAKK